jgi:zinc and cadmium transporter
MACAAPFLMGTNLLLAFRTPAEPVASNFFDAGAQDHKQSPDKTFTAKQLANASICCIIVDEGVRGNAAKGIAERGRNNVARILLQIARRLVLQINTKWPLWLSHEDNQNMPDNTLLLVLYSGLILVFSLFGGLWPFLTRVTHSRLQFYLSLSAGVMLGASFFHVMPEAMEASGPYFGWWMALGVVGLFCIERFIAPHSHEIDGERHHHAHNHEHPAHEHIQDLGKKHVHEHEHTHATGPAKDHRAAAPTVAGWMAVLGLTIHTFMNGVGLAGAVKWESEAQKHGQLHSPLWGIVLPGFAIFVAIILHKPFDALAISTVLTRKGVSRQRVGLVQFGFSLMVLVGVIAYYATSAAIAEELRGQLAGAALAFSAGTFLFIALSDLLPEVQFHKHDRIPLFLSLVLGVAFMGMIALLEGHDQNHAHNHAPAVKHEHGVTPHDADHDEHDHDHHKHNDKAAHKHVDQ